MFDVLDFNEPVFLLMHFLATLDKIISSFPAVLQAATENF